MYIGSTRWVRAGLSGGSLVVLCACVATSLPSTSAPLRSPPRLSGAALAPPIRSIVIDAGHGGHDPGASHYGLREKQLALDIAKRLRMALQAAGLTVVMTRETDQFIPLSKRPAIANRLETDLFVSVHINANRNRRVAGIEVYYPRESVVSASAQWPPAVSPGEIGTPSLTIKQILWDLVLGRSRSHAHRLAVSICRAMREDLRVPCRGTKPARFVVLREARMPAVLVEVGYVSNPAEAERLGTSGYRQAAAQAIARGIISYVSGVNAPHI